MYYIPMFSLKVITMNRNQKTMTLNWELEGFKDKLMSAGAQCALIGDKGEQKHVVSTRTTQWGYLAQTREGCRRGRRDREKEESCLPNRQLCGRRTGRRAFSSDGWIGNWRVSRTNSCLIVLLVLLVEPGFCRRRQIWVYLPFAWPYDSLGKHFHLVDWALRMEVGIDVDMWVARPHRNGAVRLVGHFLTVFRSNGKLMKRAADKQLG